MMTFFKPGYHAWPRFSTSSGQEEYGSPRPRNYSIASFNGAGYAVHVWFERRGKRGLSGIAETRAFTGKTAAFVARVEIGVREETHDAPY
jgi:hypothetical protein